MKKYIALIPLFLIACSISRNTGKNNISQFNGYKVYKIDSIKDVYVIYARDNNKLPYKILSHKENISNGEVIELNKAYPFMLDVFWSKKQELVDGTYYYNAPISVEGDSILNLYVARNIRGLKFTQ
jgi:hypothetical protein